MEKERTDGTKSAVDAHSCTPAVPLPAAAAGQPVADTALPDEPVADASVTPPSADTVAPAPLGPPADVVYAPVPSASNVHDAMTGAGLRVAEGVPVVVPDGDVVDVGDVVAGGVPLGDDDGTAGTVADGDGVPLPVADGDGVRLAVPDGDGVAVGDGATYTAPYSDRLSMRMVPPVP
jgi:hypothetical protein